MSELWEVLQRAPPGVQLRASGSRPAWSSASLLIAIAVGTLVAALRIAPVRWLNRLGGIYVEIVPQRPAAGPPVHRLLRAPAGRGPGRAVGGRDRLPRPLHRRLHRRGAALRGVRGRQGPDRGGALARAHLPADDAADHPPAGGPDRDPGARQPRAGDDQELGDRRRLAGRAPDLLNQTRAGSPPTPASTTRSSSGARSDSCS